MKHFCWVIIFFTMVSVANAAEFTVSSYNCGGLSDHYDYLRAVAMQKLMQERHIAEPENMALNDKIQKVALQILFSSDSQDKITAQQEWELKGYEGIIDTLTAPNAFWTKKMDALITNYKERPVVIHDEELRQQLEDHLRDLTQGKEADISELLQEARALMAKRIFAHHLKYDIICLQEADYLDSSILPSHYEVLFSMTSHSKNGVAWNTDRFELVDLVGNIQGRAFVVTLLNKESGKRVTVASGHITGCNPYRVENGDSAKGDAELQAVIEVLDNQEADIMVIGMDSNVTALHPRLNILKDANYQLDSENYLEATCSNPNQVLNTRIDWIALKAHGQDVTVINIPVLGVGLNSIQTNISDHKPIAAKISF